MKRFFLILIIISSTIANAQKLDGEFGVFAGVSYYLGDVNHSKQFYSPSFSYGVLYRINLNPRYTFRIEFLQVSLKGSDNDFSNGYQQSRAHSFSNKIYEIGVQTEFNFLTYNPRNFQKFTPYVIGGISLLIAPSPDYKSLFIAIPIPILSSFGSRR